MSTFKFYLEKDHLEFLSQLRLTILDLLNKTKGLPLLDSSKTNVEYFGESSFEIKSIETSDFKTFSIKFQMYCEHYTIHVERISESNVNVKVTLEQLNGYFEEHILRFISKYVKSPETDILLS